jgi:hypothetical protein
MPKIGCREIHFFGATKPSQIDFLMEKLEETVESMKLPPEYNVKIYRNVYASLGIGGLGLIVEVLGPEEEKIKEIDLKTVSKIMEFCEKEGLEVDRHDVEKHESI